jgi:cell division septal protein FtsQ
MASWSDAAPALPSPQPRRRPRSEPKRRPRARARRRGLAGGVVWIAVTAVLLTGVVALNVAVLRLNVQLDKLNAERTRLRAEKQAIASELAIAAGSPRIQLQARKKGLIQANPSETTYVRLGPRAR